MIFYILKLMTHTGSLDGNFSKNSNNFFKNLQLILRSIPGVFEGEFTALEKTFRNKVFRQKNNFILD
jgi:hypothetical protein